MWPTFSCHFFRSSAVDNETGSASETMNGKVMAAALTAIRCLPMRQLLGLLCLEILSPSYDLI